jgi:hypothetical protein
MASTLTGSLDISRRRSPASLPSTSEANRTPMRASISPPLQTANLSGSPRQFGSYPRTCIAAAEPAILRVGNRPGACKKA